MRKNVAAKLRDKWLSDRGFKSGPVGDIPDTPAIREENRQSRVSNEAREAYQMGVKPKRSRKRKHKALGTIF